VKEDATISQRPLPTIVEGASTMTCPPLFLRLKGVLTTGPVYLKIEGLNAAGSIKLKAARQMIEDLESAHILGPGKKVIESSSGNLGVALAILCAEHNYPFVCVSDPNMSPATARTIVALGGKLVVVRERDSNGGYLGKRLEYIRRSIADDPTLIWTNQYANASNALAHFRYTAKEVLEAFPAPQWVFIGTGTTGTLAGCSRYLREHSPATRIVAVDSAGSVTFGGMAAARHLPGIGTSCRPALADKCSYDRLVLVPEEHAIALCRQLAHRQGLLLGPSTGSVLVAVQDLGREIPRDHVVVALSPDFGDRYVDTVYNDDWVRAHYRACCPLSDTPSGVFS
jgi:N-(2-amino-2-carboxyethyl)-L-glutamate synthase